MRTLYFVIGLGVALLVWSGGSGLAKSEFDEAVDFVRHCSSERHIARGHDVFLSIVGEKKPSDWVAFFLSVIGKGNWVTANELDEMDGWGAVRTCPLAPDEIIIVSELDPGNDLTASGVRSRYEQNHMLIWHEVVRRFLVIIPDDANRRIRVRGYVDWGPEPVVDEEWEFPHFAPVTESSRRDVR